MHEHRLGGQSWSPRDNELAQRQAVVAATGKMAEHLTFMVRNSVTVNTMTRKVEVGDDVYYVTVSTEPPPVSPAWDKTGPYIDRHPNIHPETGEVTCK